MAPGPKCRGEAHDLWTRKCVLSIAILFFYYYNSKDPQRTLAVNYVGIQSYKKASKLATE